MEKVEDNLLNYLINRGKLISKGAESDLYLVDYLGFRCILKYRVEKSYRIRELDEKIRRKRTIREVSIIHELHEAGVPVPPVIYVDVQKNFFLMEFIEGIRLRDALITGEFDENVIAGISRRLGVIIADIHNMNISHGDLTTANIIIKPKMQPYIIDFGLSEKGVTPEEKAVDIDVFYRVLESNHTEIRELMFTNFLEKYKENVNNYDEVILRFNKIRRMGRYIEGRRKKRY